ncbi:unnamed protein product [Lupinus luteus]|uniref:Uncharacterized protein n=1 Tax=Lupinus luteus TaxID=3873 RepID=A0AAV1YG53_LUPLU
MEIAFLIHDFHGSRGPHPRLSKNNTRMVFEHYSVGAPMVNGSARAAYESAITVTGCTQIVFKVYTRIWKFQQDKGRVSTFKRDILILRIKCVSMGIMLIMVFGEHNFVNPAVHLSHFNKSEHNFGLPREGVKER